MNRLFYYIMLCMMVCFSSVAEAKTIRELFADEPDDIFILLPKSTRLDMLDYFDVGKMVKVENSLSSGKKVSRLLKVTDSSIDVAVTQSSQVSMTLLTSAKADSVIAVVQTYQVPYFDSQISFYDVDWNKLNTSKYFDAPTVKSFILPGTDKKIVNDILQSVKFSLISYSIEQADNGDVTLTASLNLEGVMVKEDYDRIKDYLSKTIVYRLSNLKFKPTKQ
ncbi:MAG: DUF3256 family protein [bacterium]|nr:DUF3256 family protein [bacterium]MDD6026138.1 DUF3256 family protein [bacterium]